MLLIIPSSALADSIQVVTQMPVPVPILPAVIPEITAADLPEVNTSTLPAVDTSEWASSVSAIQEARTTLNRVLSDAQEQVTSVVSDASAEMGKARSVINTVRSYVGSPLSDVYVLDSGTPYTAYKVASDMTNSIQVSVAYLRGLSRLGGVGLDVTFVLLGLGWMAFINILDLLVRASTALGRLIASVIGQVIEVLKFVVDLAQLIVFLIRIITPFL